MHRGYIKIHRKSVDNPLFKKPLIWHFWVYCLIRANHEETVLPFNNKPITIKKGSFIMSLNHAVEDTGLSKQNIRTAIKALTNFKMIEKSTQELTQQATMINICSYSLYQKNKKEVNTVINTPPTQVQHGPNTPPTLDKEPLNTIKKKNKTKKSDPPKIEDFLESVSESTKNLCKENNIMQGKFKQLAESCFDHFKGKGEKKADWNATVRNWIRKDIEFNHPPEKTNQPKPRPDNFIP